MTENFFTCNPQFSSVKVNFSKSAALSNIVEPKVSFPMPACGDLISPFYFCLKILTAEEAFKRDCWRFVETCNEYLQYIDLKCNFTTKNLKATICAKNYTRNGFKDVLTIVVGSNDKRVNVVRTSTRRGKVSKKERNLKIDLFWFTFLLGKCFKKWPQNSQFQFSMK